MKYIINNKEMYLPIFIQDNNNYIHYYYKNKKFHIDNYYINLIYHKFSSKLSKEDFDKKIKTKNIKILTSKEFFNTIKQYGKTRKNIL